MASEVCPILMANREEGMQNNLIACVIVVFLCIISSSIVGTVSVLARMVPAAMVNAYLYLTACKFTPSVVTRPCHYASFDSFITIVTRLV
ncbi:hypothetical protein EGR_11319 [Echinococcus granulosus]|uniref:Uncharacterized protein n=1 Tax=Echinococcus granulosus TaxID=6210 RepID=W6TYF8_ECHGR|nr:hypothetical protein EGR_11319 [Echinococcus granulosus]EUB53830.1 hypothetical protein EGR_11319 [Echinococcus granulosus]